MNDQQKAARVYQIIRERYEAGENALSNTQLAWELTYSSQISIIPVIPLMQRAAQQDGFYLERPCPSNGWCLTLHPVDDLDAAMSVMLTEISRDRHRATRQRNDVTGGILNMLAQNAVDPQIVTIATRMAARNAMAKQLDDMQRKDEDDLATLLRENIYAES